MTAQQSTYLRALQDAPTTASLQLVTVNLVALEAATINIPLGDAGFVRADRAKPMYEAVPISRGSTICPKPAAPRSSSS
jgi:hypothetical protein